MKMKRILALVLAFALTITATIGGTVAYLTKDAGKENNVFAVGDIDITLTEDVEVLGEGGEVKEIKDAEDKIIGADYTEIMPGDYLKKEVTLTNDGVAPAYVAVTVKLNNALEINKAIDETYGDDEAQEWYDMIFDGWGLNHSKDLDGDGTSEAGIRLTITGKDMPEHVLQVDSLKTLDEYTLFYEGNWFGEKSDVIPFDGYYTTGMGKYEMKYIYYIYLPAGESTTLFNGLNIPAEFDADQLAMFDGLKIDVEAKAIQADNMGIAEKYKDDENGKAKTAFEVLAGTIDAADLDVNNNPNVPAGDDDSVTYPIPAGTEYTTVSNSDELKAALNNKDAVILLKDGVYNWGGTGHNGTNQTVSIYGESKNAVIYHTLEGSEGADYDFDGYTVNFYGLTISGEQNGKDYPGWARMAATYNDCVFKQTYCLYERTHEFNYCTFDVTGDQYSVRTWGAENATFNNCTFNSDGKAVLLYGTANTKLTVNNCEFNDKGGLSDLKAAIEIGNDYNKSYELIVNNTVVNGYEINDKGINTGTTLWANKNSMGTDKLNVVVDGVDVY